MESEETQEKRAARRNVATPDFTEQPDVKVAHMVAPSNVFAPIPEDQDQEKPLTNLVVDNIQKEEELNKM